MGFVATIEINGAIKEIDEGRWVIPASQPRLVWAPAKLELLFESLMGDHPIGSMLLWRSRRRREAVACPVDPDGRPVAQPTSS